jgi:thiamine pyrophosphate-dependent acetolactate synthase large subunit-like protein
LRQRDNAREGSIDTQAKQTTDKGLNPVQLFRELDTNLDDNTTLVAMAVICGDFILYPSAPPPLSWLDPGVFGTLGVGAGFALGAKLVHRTVMFGLSTVMEALLIV